MSQVTEVVTAAELQRNVEEAVQRTPVIDVHTHLYPASFGGLCLWGIDELVNYHYLVAELFRSSPVTPQQFWALDKIPAGRPDLGRSLRKEHAAFGGHRRRGGGHGQAGA